MRFLASCGSVDVRVISSPHEALYCFSLTSADLLTNFLGFIILRFPVGGRKSSAVWVADYERSFSSLPCRRKAVFDPSLHPIQSSFYVDSNLEDSTEYKIILFAVHATDTTGIENDPDTPPHRIVTMLGWMTFRTPYPLVSSKPRDSFLSLRTCPGAYNLGGAWPALVGPAYPSGAPTHTHLDHVSSMSIVEAGVKSRTYLFDQRLSSFMNESLGDRSPPSMAAREAAIWAAASRGVEESLLAFINSAGFGTELRLAMFYVNYPSALNALEAAVDRGCDVKIVGPGCCELSTELWYVPPYQKYRLQHNKFVVRAAVGSDNVMRPNAVWTGGANVDLNGLYGHLNGVFVISCPHCGGLKGASEATEGPSFAVCICKCTKPCAACSDVRAICDAYYSYWQTLWRPTAQTLSDRCDAALRASTITPSPQGLAAMARVPAEATEPAAAVGSGCIFAPIKDATSFTGALAYRIETSRRGAVLALPFGVHADFQEAFVKASQSDAAPVVVLCEDATKQREPLPAHVWFVTGAAVPKVATRAYSVTRRRIAAALPDGDTAVWIVDWEAIGIQPPCAKADEAVSQCPCRASGFFGGGGDHPTGLGHHVHHIHAKVVLIDPLAKDPVLVAGSCNLCPSSFNNDENMFVYAPGGLPSRGDTAAKDSDVPDDPSVRPGSTRESASSPHPQSRTRIEPVAEKCSEPYLCHACSHDTASNNQPPATSATTSPPGQPQTPRYEAFDELVDCNVVALLRHADHHSRRAAYMRAFLAANSGDPDANSGVPNGKVGISEATSKRLADVEVYDDGTWRTPTPDEAGELKRPENELRLCRSGGWVHLYLASSGYRNMARMLFD